MKKTVRALGIGLFLAGAALYVDHAWGIPYISSPEESAPAATREIAKLEKKVQQQAEEIEQLQKENELLASQQAAEADDVAADDEATQTNGTDEDMTGTESETETVQTSTENDGAISATLYVYEGMSIYDIGKQAEDLGLVKIGRELELFLSKREYARSIQKGAFDLHSNMTYEEMASIITGKQ